VRHYWLFRYLPENTKFPGLRTKKNAVPMSSSDELYRPQHSVPGLGKLPVSFHDASSSTRSTPFTRSTTFCSFFYTNDIFHVEMPKTMDSHNSRLKDPLKDATNVALKQVVDPLVDLMFDAGVTVREFSQLVRERAVRAAARRVVREGGRESKSRIAILTGLPRSEVARILRSVDVSRKKRLGQHPVRKVLAAWFESPRFLTAAGEPAVLPIFGRRRSFEQLVAMHSGGIPVRAMLDELTQIDAIERLSDQRVRAKSRVPILTGLTGSAVAVIGERTRDLLDTLTNNLRRTSTPLFEGTALLSDADPEFASLIRREIAEQGESFINSANALFSRAGIRQNRLISKAAKKCRLGVTVYYFQDDIDSAKDVRPGAAHSHRTNLRRQRRQVGRKRTAIVVPHSAPQDRS